MLKHKRCHVSDTHVLHRYDLIALVHVNEGVLVVFKLDLDDLRAGLRIVNRFNVLADIEIDDVVSKREQDVPR